MLCKAEIKQAIRDLEALNLSSLTNRERAAVDTSMGLFYEAYAQAVLNERNIRIDVSGICGFVKFVNVLPLKFSRSFRSP